MKVAVVHDWLVTNAGAEKVLKSILSLYKDADLFSIVDFLDDKDRNEILNNKKVTTSFIQKLPFAKKYFRNYLPLFPKAIESFNLSSYDLIISSSWAFAKGVKKQKNQTHICYCHTPIRYAWDMYDEYTKNLKQPKKFFVQKSLKSIKEWDRQNSENVDFFIANSFFVADRIFKSYGRESKVIYPPVDVERFSLYEKKEEFYLTASRLVSYKKTNLIVDAFNKMPDKKLIVIGDGEEYKKLKSMAHKNITLLGSVDDEKLLYYMQRAKAFVYAAIEDFGIVPIEALSCGTPVISLNQGGTKESIKEFCGVHFQNQTVYDIIKAVLEFEKKEFDLKKISNYAKSFSDKRFLKEFRKFVQECYG